MRLLEAIVWMGIEGACVIVFFTSVVIQLGLHRKLGRFVVFIWGTAISYVTGFWFPLIVINVMGTDEWRHLMKTDDTGAGVYLFVWFGSICLTAVIWNAILAQFWRPQNEYVTKDDSQ